MIFDKGLKKSASVGVAPSVLTLESAAGWDLDRVAMSTDRALKVSTVYRCVELLSSSMALLPLYIMRETDKERLTDHHLGRVLWGRANEAMTSYDYALLMERRVLLRGNAYAYIQRDPSSGWPVELIPMDPDLVTIFVDPSGRLWYLYANPRTGEVTKLHPEDVIHYKGPSSDGISGISVLKSAALTIKTALAAQQHQADLYQNGGQPAGILRVEGDLGGVQTVKGEDGSETEIPVKEVIRREWEKYHGPGKAFRVAILDHGLDYKPIGLSNVDSQFVESEDVRVADICRFFATPTHLVYAGKQSYASNEQNSLEFVKYTLQSKITQRDQTDSYSLLLPSERAAGLRIKRELKAFLRGDTAAQSAWYRTMMELGPYSVNEVRDLEDRPAVPGGDKRRASLNYVPLDSWELLSLLRAMRGTGGTDNSGQGDEENA